MEGLEITLKTLLSIAGGVAVIGGAGAVIYKWLTPAFKLTKRVGELERKADADYLLLKELNELNKAQSMAIVSLINHLLDGNGVEKMKETRDQMLNALAERKY